jgi:DNA-binding HxlR family transcriptional regulator
MSSSTPLIDLIALGKQRWMVALLANLAAHEGGRFVELLNRLGLSRDSLVRTLEGARAAGWVKRNPGHGHPLRPEYILTDAGKQMANKASRIIEAQSALHIPTGALSRWGLPIIHTISEGHQRFNDLSRCIAPAGPRAISQSLRALTSHDLIVRELVDGYPPASLYKLTSNGSVLAHAI